MASIGPKEGKCAVCGKEIGLYDSYWLDETKGEMFCVEPNSENPSPVGACYISARDDLLKRHWREAERFVRDLGLNYYTDG